MKKEVEITVRTFQNSLFLCCYALETSTIAFQYTFSTKSVRNRGRFWRISMEFRRKSSIFSKMGLRKKIQDSNIDEKNIFLTVSSNLYIPEMNSSRNVDNPRYRIYCLTPQNKRDTTFWKTIFFAKKKYVSGDELDL